MMINLIEINNRRSHKLKIQTRKREIKRERDIDDIESDDDIATSTKAALKAMSSTVEKIFQVQNQPSFEGYFEGDARTTLPFLDAFNIYCKIHTIVSEPLQFKALFGQISEGIRQLYVQEHMEEENDIKELKRYLMEEYPPPFNKVFFTKVLKRVRMRCNESPKEVWKRWKTIRNKIDRAINLMNVNAEREQDKIKPLDKETLHDALKDTFIVLNGKNHRKMQNNGKIQGKQ